MDGVQLAKLLIEWIRAGTNIPGQQVG